VNDQHGVANILNDYFVNIANDIGSPDTITTNDDLASILADHEESNSVKFINNNISNGNSFNFIDVTDETVFKKLVSINTKKSMGHDMLPPKLIKLGAKHLHRPIRYLVNMSFSTSEFPNDLKAAEVTPIFKKNDRLKKENYRPISVLPCFSKIFESICIDQLSLYFESLFAPSLSGFRKSHNCQHVLIDFIEKIKCLWCVTDRFISCV